MKSIFYGAVTVLVDPVAIKNLAINCRCTKRTVFEVPGAMTESPTLIVVLSCPDCGQHYGLKDNIVHRLNEHFEIETGESLERSTHLKGKMVLPGNRTVH